MKNTSFLVRNVRLLDPEAGTDSVGCVGVSDGVITVNRKRLPAEPELSRFGEIIDGKGCWLMPGVVDLCARLREPGHAHKATMKSESGAALAAGVTALCMPPDTKPVIDHTAVVNRVNRIAKAAGGAYVYMLGALTQGLGGTALAEMSALKNAGCVGVSNGLLPVESTLVARRALEYAASLGLTVHVVPLDQALANGGCAHEGPVATRLGLAPIPVSAEAIAIRQWLSLIEDTGARVHFGRLSSARGVALFASAVSRDLPVSADVAAHQLFMTDQDVDGFNAMAHVIPPLRSAADRDALREAVAAGLIGTICSDHQPHEVDAKINPFPMTEAGLSTLETLLPLTLKLVHEGLLSPLQAAERLSSAPARVLGIGSLGLAVGSIADLVLIDPREQWTLDPTVLLSRGRNTPFAGATFAGRALRSWVGRG